MYDTNSDDDLNGYFKTTDHYNENGNDNKEHIHRAKGHTIQKNRKKKPSSNTGKGTFLKATHNKETNKEDKDETLDTSYNTK